MSSRNNCYYGGGRSGRSGRPLSELARGAPMEAGRFALDFHFADVPAEFLTRLKSSYSLLKKSENVRQMLLSYLETCENPYAAALQIVYESDFDRNQTNTLAVFVIEEFCPWAKKREHLIKHMLTPELKYDAFCLVTAQRNSSVTKAVIEIMKMQEDSTLFIDKIKDFIASKKYKEACQCAVALGLMNQFPIDQIILPLILQDKLPIAEEGLATDQKLQIELITQLDQLVGERSLRNTIDHLVNQLEVPDVKLDRFMSHKPLGKLVAKLVKTFNLPSDVTPNLNQKRSAGALNFIFHKRFFEKSLSPDSWKEMVSDAVKNNYTLQQELVLMLTGCNEVDEALYWALEFQIPQHKWPLNVSLRFKEDPLASREFPRPAESSHEETEDWEDANDYHALALPDSAIIMVDTEPLLMECFDYINNHDSKIVGIDSEWKPAFGGQQNELALIQLATWDRIFILDVIGMSTIPPSAWHEASKLFFENSNITKLGFSLQSDMAMIRSSIPALSNLKLHGTGYLDLSTVWRRLQNKGMTFPHSGEKANTSGESLSKLVLLCFGRALNKSDQFSNWELRPLRQGQMRYAALDAFVLLELHREMLKLADNQALPFLEICDEIIMGFRSKSAPAPGGYRRGRGRGRRPTGYPNNGQGSSRGQDPQDVSSVKFLADQTFCGLGLALRRCGVDCAILDGPARSLPRGEAEAVLQMAVDQGRIVLTKGLNQQWFESHLDPEAVYAVQSNSVNDQLKEVLRTFSIAVKEANVLTRCMVCNSNAFDRVGQAMMLELAGVPPETPDGVDDGGLGLDLGAAAASAVPASPPEVKISDEIRSWVLSENASSVAQGLTMLGARIEITRVPLGVLKSVQVFYICSQCGKVYWEGTHHGRMLENCKKSGIIQDGPE